MHAVNGIHHITAIAGNAQENLDFYVGVLGLRLVKKSINQDVPDTYHLFFADGAGSPGTDLTFFPWPDLPPRRDGIGQWGEIAFSVDPSSLHYWEDRLGGAGVSMGAIEMRFGGRYLPFVDPHGLRLSLTDARPHEDFAIKPWSASPVPAEYQLHGFAGVRLEERSIDASIHFLSEGFGFAEGESDGEWTRLILGGGEAGRWIDVRQDAEAPRGQWGVGAVHHVAWRVDDEEHQTEVRARILGVGGHPTETIDRFWFRSVYVKEPGGALAELATDGPGFGVDEDPEHLGERLVLPPWYEEQRGAIERALPPLAHAHYQRA